MREPSARSSRRPRSASRRPTKDLPPASRPSASRPGRRPSSTSPRNNQRVERALTEQLIGYDTSTVEGIRQCAGFINGWLEARDIEASQIPVRDLPVTIAEVGPKDAEVTVLLHGHLDVVPGLAE